MNLSNSSSGVLKILVLLGALLLITIIYKTIVPEPLHHIYPTGVHFMEIISLLALVISILFYIIDFLQRMDVEEIEAEKYDIFNT